MAPDTLSISSYINVAYRINRVNEKPCSISNHSGLGCFDGATVFEEAGLSGITSDLSECSGLVEMG